MVGEALFLAADPAPAKFCEERVQGVAANGASLLVADRRQDVQVDELNLPREGGSFDVSPIDEALK
ncbi:hypothetical protein [Amycolatopsis speibonae]|uniref:Uncharacterized protein n=1 Tax=Amycolatopsis speibonae TaxID=1450224 RepID=A0ABV7P785_9PSEU